MAVTDNFNRADGGLGANWTTDSSFSALAIVSNACKGSTGGTHNVAVYTTGGTIAADQYAQVKVTATGGFIGPVLRSNGAGTFYTCYYSSGNATLYKWITGSASLLQTGSAITPAVNDVIYFEAVGSTLTMKVNGVTVCTVSSETSITGAGYTGIDIYDTAGAVDDFQGGVVGAVTVTVNLTGVSASPAVGTLTFNGSLPLVGVAATPVIGTGTVQIIGDVSVSPVGVAAAPGIGTGTVAIEGEVIAPPDQGLFTGGPPHWYGLPEDEKVYLTGVEANPQIGRITPFASPTWAEIEKMFPFPRREAPVTRLVPRRKKPEAPKPTAFVYMTGVHPVPKIGNVTTKMFYEDNDEELSSILRMMDVDEELITALKLAK